jgi:hypothetical protein
VSTIAGDTALWAVVVAAAAVVVNAGTSIFLHFRRAKFDDRLAQKKSDLDLALAERKVALDLAASDRKRQQDLAEDILAGFYEVARVLPAIRSPASYDYEGRSRHPQDGETEAIASLRNAYYVIIERLDRNREVISKLMSKQFTARARFGNEAATPFQELNDIIARITVSAQMLIRTAGNAEPLPPSQQKWQSDIWADWGKDDQISARIAAMVADAERIFRPTLKASS